MAQSSEQAPFTSENVASFLARDIYEKSLVNALPKVEDFLRVLRFPPAGKSGYHNCCKVK